MVNDWLLVVFREEIQKRKVPWDQERRTGRKDLDGVWCSAAGGGLAHRWQEQLATLLSPKHPHSLLSIPSELLPAHPDTRGLLCPKELLRNLRRPRLGSHQPAFIQQTSAEPPLCSIGTGQAQGDPHPLVSGSTRHQWPVRWPLPGDKRSFEWSN